MYFGFICFYCFTIPFIFAKSLSTLNGETTQLPHNNITVELSKKEFNNTKLTLITEGGSVEPEGSSISLPKENHSNLINLDKEIGKTKGKSIVPRKGVVYNPVEDNVSSSNSSKERIDTNIDSKISHATVLSTVHEDIPLKLSTKADILTNVTKKTTQLHLNITSPVLPPPKKPLVLSAEAISETDRKAQAEKGRIESSSKSIVSDQFPSPKGKLESIVRSSHPGMVMPIVITMLVVPMFAVLGYMALRRGQEAWKNRHYKRMDFLLDDDDPEYVALQYCDKFYILPF